MDDETYEIFSKLSDKIQTKIQDDLLECFDLIYNYAHKYSFREDCLNELEPSSIKRIVSRYFRNIESRFMQDLIYELRTTFNKLSEDIESANRLLGDNMYDVTNHLLSKNINQGLSEFDSEFLYDFKNECLADFRPSSRNNPDFEDIIKIFKRNLGDRLEEIMEDYRKQINNYVVRSTEEVKEELHSEIEKNPKFNKNEYEDKIMEIFHDNKELIISNPLCADAFKDLVGFYNFEIKNKDKISQDTLQEYERLYKITIKIIKNEKNNKVQNKFKEIKKQELVQTEVPDFENDNEFHIIL